MAAIALEWDGTTYKFDAWKPDLGQMITVKEFTGLNYLPFLRQMSQLDPACVIATYWLMKMQAGQPVNIEDVQIADPVGYMLAVTNAINAEAAGNPPGVENTPSSTPTPGDSETATSSTSPASAI